MKLRLAYHYHIPARQEGGKIVMPGYEGVFVESLAEECGKVTCFLHSPVLEDHFTGDYTIRSENVELVDIGPHSSVPKRIFFTKKYTHSLIERRGELDVLLLRGASPLLPGFAEAANHLPITLLLVNDPLAGIDDIQQPNWRRELIRLWWNWNNSKTHKIAKQNLTFVNSHKLYEQLRTDVPNLIETRTTTLNQTDFYERDDTCQTPPYHLLYTGRITWEKGLMDMVDALAKLVEQGYDCLLDLVGMGVRNDKTLEDIREKASELGILERVIYHGYKPLGPQLFDFYRNADIYIIASKSSFEGFPRTIWEAMANSLPVVATRVGSIPDFIGEAAELVNPNDIYQLSESIIALLNGSELRKEYIKKGLSLAKKNTLQARARQMVEQITSWIN
jgi:glycosyltransferase involved in cell wall biosynthesis